MHVVPGLGIKPAGVRGAEEESSIDGARLECLQQTPCSHKDPKHQVLDAFSPFCSSFSCFRSSVARSRMVLNFCLLQTSLGCFASEDRDLGVQVCLGVQIQFHIAGMSISTLKCLWDSGLKSGLSVL